MGRKPLPPDERRSERLMVNLTPGEREALEEEADREGRPVSNLLAAIVRQHLSRRRR